MALMSRPFQFSLRVLLVATLVVAAFLGGMAIQRHLDKRKSPQNVAPVDIVVGVHGSDLEDFMGDMAQKLQAVPDGQKKED
jgi:hypothetical protein